MEEFNKKTLDTLEKDLVAALKAVADKHNIVLSIGNMRYDASSVNIKLSGLTKGEGIESAQGAKDAQLKKDFASHAGFYELTKNDLGKTFLENGKTMTIIGWDRKKKKLNIILQDQNGDRYKASPEQVKRQLGR